MPDDYASHLPVLRAVLAAYKPKRVLELGSGPYSTPFFLDAGAELTSLETDREWCERAAKYGEFDLRLVGNVADSLPTLTAYDLIFVDDSDNAADREATIHAVLTQPHPLTVIHDAEVYADAIRGQEKLVFCLATPHTAVVYPDGYDRRYSDLFAAVNAEAFKCVS